MVTVPIVVAANFVIGFLCLVAAFAIWKATKLLKRLTRLAVIAECNVHNLLDGAPSNIIKGKSRLATLRVKYQALKPKLQQAQQLINLLRATRFIWGRRVILVPPPRPEGVNPRR
ncbi:MAG: hypothetical protein ACKO24_00995 [Leptolyngbyaceae cyanobacterium]